MIERFTTAISPWTYSPQPVVRIAASFAIGAAIGYGMHRLTVIFTNYYFKDSGFPKDIVPRIPDNLTLVCAPDQFQGKYLRAKDLPITVQMPLNFDNSTTAALPGVLNVSDIFILICRFLRPADYQRLAMTSKKAYVICKSTCEKLYNQRDVRVFLNGKSHMK